MRRTRRRGGRPLAAARSRAAPLAAALVLAAAVALLAGCGDEPPAVLAVEWRLEARPLPSGQRYESLSAFASVKGGAADGAVEELWIVDDASALAWKLTVDDWIKSADGSDAWIGGAPLAMYDFSPLARGTYRAVAIDLAGRRAERSFTLAGEFPSRPSPTISVDAKGAAVVSSWPETLVLAYDGAGELAGSATAPSSRSPLATLLGPAAAPKAVEIAAYGYDPTIRMGAFSERVAVK
jgi:hypothetical protein